MTVTKKELIDLVFDTFVYSIGFFFSHLVALRIPEEQQRIVEFDFSKISKKPEEPLN